MWKSLRAQLSLSILLIVVITVGLISVFSNLLINRQFEEYIARQEKERSKSIVTDLGTGYNSIGGWSQDFLHTIGMYSLYDGYILKIYNTDGKILWDAENHDVSLCGTIMSEIIERMEDAEKSGNFETHVYDITRGINRVGSVSITYYGPFFFTESDYTFIKTLNNLLFVIGIVSAAFAVMIGGILAQRLSVPIAKTAEIATRISEGKYDIRFEGTPNTRELKEMAAAVNHLAQALSEQEALRKRLTLDVAHELRTPLSSVGSHLEAMIEGIWEAAPERLQGCLDEVKRLGALVSELQELAKTESENLSLNKSPTDMLALVKSVNESFKAKAAKKNLALTESGESVVVFADERRVRQVLTNLVSNAVKYTPENGRVSLEVGASETECFITISDTGMGIPEAELPYIFERFYRTDKSRNRKTGGTGIGLTIAQSITEAHGGKIDAESAAGKGSRFTVTLPR
ncbi:MAG: HAMP domain-containing protein [Clostridiales bacterium]|jgi:signal transduction histidine kinase|nr:HAMP domain-containing protein [Clostridiales bacterium]